MMWTEPQGSTRIELYIRSQAIISIALCALFSGACALGSRVAPSTHPLQSAKAMRPPGSSGLSVPTLEARDGQLSLALVKVLVARTPEHLSAAAFRYYQLGVLDTAMDYYSEALDQDPTYAPALDGSARIWRDWGQIGAALGNAHRATYFAPSAETWNTLGTILQSLGLVSEAAAAYTHALALNASASYARSNLCYLAFLQGEYQRAILDCAAALTTDRGSIVARNNLGLAYAASGDPARSLEAFSLAGGDAVASYNTGIVLLAQHRYAAAVRAFEAAYHAEPTFDRAHARARYARRLALSEGKDVDGTR